MFRSDRSTARSEEPCLHGSKRPDRGGSGDTWRCSLCAGCRASARTSTFVTGRKARIGRYERWIRARPFPGRTGPRASGSCPGPPEGGRGHDGCEIDGLNRCPGARPPPRTTRSPDRRSSRRGRNLGRRSGRRRPRPHHEPSARSARVFLPRSQRVRARVRAARLPRIRIPCRATKVVACASTLLADGRASEARASFEPAMRGAHSRIERVSQLGPGGLFRVWLRCAAVG